MRHLLMVPFGLLTACDGPVSAAKSGERESPVDSGETQTTDTATDTGTSDTGDAPAVSCALVEASPRTVARDQDAEITWSWACDEALPEAGSWSVSVPGVAASAAASVEGPSLALTAVLPADALPAGVFALEVALDGALVEGLTAPVRIRASDDEVAAALAGTGWNTWAGLPAEAGALVLLDLDTNGNLDLLSYAVRANGDVIQMAQQADGQGTFRERRGLAHVEADGFTSGAALWMESDTAGVLSIIGATEPGEVAHVRQSTFVDRDWTVTVQRVNHGFMGERVPDVLLGVEPEWYAPETLLMNLLGVVERDGTPVGVYCEGTVCWEWDEIGDVTPASVMSGEGFVGAWTHGELGGVQPVDSVPQYWAVDARDPAAGLTVHTIDYDYDAELWAEPRAFSLPDPGFAVRAVASGGHDLDGDGNAELVLELWGDGAWQAWLLRGASDKADDRAPLLLGEARDRALWASPAPAAGGATVLLPTTFSANGRALRSTRLLADAPTVGQARAALVVVEEWSLDAVMDGASVASAPVQRGVIGRAEAGPAGSCETLDGAPLPACRRGLLPQSVAAAGVDGAASPEDPPRPGDHLLVAPGQGATALVVSRGLHPAASAPAPLLAVNDRLTARVGWSDELRLLLDGDDAGALCHSGIALVDHDDEDVVLGQQAGGCGAGIWTAWRGGEAVALAGAAPAPATPLPAAGEPLLVARADDGAVDVLAVDLDAGALTPAFSSPGAADPALLHLDAGRPGAVWVGPTGPPALPWAADGWTTGAALPGEEGDGVLVVAAPSSAGGCPWRVLAARQDGADWVTGELFSSTDPACADLPVPLTAARLDGEGEALLSAFPDGQLLLTRFEGATATHRGVGLPWEPEADPAALAASAGDLDGDGLDDVILAGATGAVARVLWSDGLGGLHLRDDDLGAGHNLAGVAGPAPGRPAPLTAWGEVPERLQRVVEPVSSP